MSEIFSLVLALFAVIAIMLGLIYFMKWLLKRTSYGKNTKGLRVAACIGVGQDKSVAAIKAGNKSLLIGVTGGKINLLCELDEADMDIIENSGVSSNHTSGKSFAEIFRDSIAKKVSEDDNDKLDGNS